MLSNIIASSDELTVLTKVLDKFCAANGVNDSAKRSHLARKLIELFGAGVDTEAALFAALGKFALQPATEAAA